jgi:hypothetical protein
MLWIAGDGLPPKHLGFPAVTPQEEHNASDRRVGTAARVCSRRPLAVPCASHHARRMRTASRPSPASEPSGSGRAGLSPAVPIEEAIELLVDTRLGDHPAVGASAEEIPFDEPSSNAKA